MSSDHVFNVLLLRSLAKPNPAIVEALEDLSQPRFAVHQRPHWSKGAKSDADPNRMDLAIMDAKQSAADDRWDDWLSELSKTLPVVVWLEKDDPALALRSIKLGAQEVISGGTNAGEDLKRRLVFAIERYRHTHALAETHSASREQTEQKALLALDKLPTGIILVDEDARVVFMNSKADELVRHDTGLRVSAGGRCEATDEGERRALRDLIRRIARNADARDGQASDVENGDDHHAMMLSQSCPETPLSIMVAPVGSRRDRSGVAIFITSPNTPVPISVNALRRLYELTDAEAALLIGLVRGATLADLADERQVSQHTVRAQLKQIFSKTGTKRQSELVKLVLTGPAVLMSDPAGTDTP